MPGGESTARAAKSPPAAATLQRAVGRPASGVASWYTPAVPAAGLSVASPAGFGKLVQGTRRHNLIYVDDLTAEAEPEGVRLTFTLPAGSYATVLLREV